MTDTKTGLSAQQTTPQDTQSAGQQTSSNDAATSRKRRRKTEADKLSDVTSLLGDALAQEPITPVSDGDDNEGQDAHSDDTGVHEPVKDNRSVTDGEGDDADDLSGTSASSPPATLADIADALGVKAKDLYDIDIPLAGGEVVKLGAMKDAFKSKQAADAEIATRQAALDERETQIVNDQMLWAQMGQELTNNLSPETRQQFAQRMQAQQAHERDALMRAVPELRDQTKFDAFRDEVVQTLSRYGFQPHEIVVSDHRQLLVVRDLARANARLKQLREFKPTPKTANGVKPNGRGGASSNKSRLINNARGGTQSDKVAAAAALINGG